MMKPGNAIHIRPFIMYFGFFSAFPLPTYNGLLKILVCMDSYYPSLNGEKLKKDSIDPFFSRLDNLEVQTYRCCHKEAKISPNLKMEGGYCPFCGEMQSGN